MSFDNALEIVLKQEGGYSNDPLDRGGATNFGVIQKTYDTYRDNKKLPRQEVKLITFDEVKSIYLSYWKESGAELLLDQGYEKLSIVLLDIGINHGSGTARQLLQRALGLIEDGVFGPNSMAAIHSHTDIDLANRVLTVRHWLYIDIIDRRPEQAKFLKSWMKRIKHIRQAIGDARFLQ